jgi:hypothetical protein
MIDLTFYGGGQRKRSKKDQQVLDAWKEYLDHLYITRPTDQSSAINWDARRDDLFFDLLDVTAQNVGYSFDKVQIKRGAYSPVAHGVWEQDLLKIRTSLLGVLSGNPPLKIKLAKDEGSPSLDFTYLNPSHTDTQNPD